MNRLIKINSRKLDGKYDREVYDIVWEALYSINIFLFVVIAE
jgi:hypothetical protein